MLMLNQKVADNINDIDEFGDLPPALLDGLSQILSKRRAMTSRTLDLLLRPDLDTVSIYDCGSRFTRRAYTCRHLLIPPRTGD